LSNLILEDKLNEVVGGMSTRAKVLAIVASSVATVLLVCGLIAVYKLFMPIAPANALYTSVKNEDEATGLREGTLCLIRDSMYNKTIRVRNKNLKVRALNVIAKNNDDELEPQYVDITGFYVFVSDDGRYFIRTQLEPEMASEVDEDIEANIYDIYMEETEDTDEEIMNDRRCVFWEHSQTEIINIVQSSKSTHPSKEFWDLRKQQELRS